MRQHSLFHFNPMERRRRRDHRPLQEITPIRRNTPRLGRNPQSLQARLYRRGLSLRRSPRLGRNPQSLQARLYRRLLSSMRSTCLCSKDLRLQCKELPPSRY
jgi:hypothetical protein